MRESGRAVVVFRVQCVCARLKTLFNPLWRALVARQHYKLATTMSNSVERALPSLDLTGSLSQVAERWRQWKRSY